MLLIIVGLYKEVGKMNPIIGLLLFVALTKVENGTFEGLNKINPTAFT
ncbi:MAG: hypothetical protein V3T58_01835 [Candidatus Hydrothermarchaeales archaeon]